MFAYRLKQVIYDFSPSLDSKLLGQMDFDTPNLLMN